MNRNHNFFARNTRARALSVSLCLAVTAWTMSASMSFAGEASLADQPLATAAAVQPKPNLLFILDDSGSMDSDYMPDNMSNSGRFGYWSAQCNGVAFDPDEKYPLPLKADKTAYPNVSFTNAPDDGYNSSSSKVDLTESFYYVYTGTQPKMSWSYNFAGVETTTPFYQECMTSISSGSTVFTRVNLKTQSSEVQQKYANWYSYYRKRYLLMRTAMGQALSKLDDTYRVGLSTISDTQAIDGTKYFRDVKDFTGTQRSNVYTSLYSAPPSSWTPLRGALSKAGRYFAKKAPGQTYDPMQYACQRNYALLSTDGYWNTNIETSSYGPYVVDSNTSVGQQDGTEARPMQDSSSTVTTRVTNYTAIALRDRTSNTQTRTRNWSRVMTTYTAGTGSCSGKFFKRTFNQTSDLPQKQTQYFVTPQQSTYSYSVTDLLINGLLSESTTSSTTMGSWTTKSGASTSTIGTDTGTPTAFTTSGSFTSSTCVTSSSATSYSTPTAGSWSSWSPSSLTYTESTPVVGAYTAGTPSQSTVTMGGVANTLADVAQYYWANDLRKESYNNCKSTSSGVERDVCADVLTPVGVDTNKAQHMATYTIGLGTNGTLTYDPNYPTQTSGDFADLIAGRKIWPEPGNGKGAENIDDLWHAAVNGRGRYFSAMSASGLSDAINSVFNSVKAEAGAAAAAATTSLELISGDNNKLFSASYTTQEWTGDLKAYVLNGTTGVLSTTAAWSAKTALDARVNSLTHTDRKIYFNSGSVLTPFLFSNLSTTQKGYFNNLCASSSLSQCSKLTTDEKTIANSGDKLVNYLRGDRSYEIGNTDGAFRKRTSVMGDIINGAPVYVGKPPFKYADTGYADFVTAQASRKPVVYIAANDGMLHAFSAGDSDGGTELWAFVPSAVMSNMYRLAEEDYAGKHRYFVDGPPTVADVKIGGAWKTILVGGLNKGGKSYYALDVTNPESPRFLWEFTTANMGYTFSAPVVTKRQDGTWVVAVTSGINNSTGDGKGHLYLINAATGALVLDLATTEGSASTPSNLTQLNVWVDDDTNNTALRFYGGDMMGNLWRFDTDARYGSAASVMKLAQLRTGGTTAQPITTRPVTIEIFGKPVVVVATGRYLGDTDVTDTNVQSIYAIRDPLTDVGWGDVQANPAKFTQQTMTVSGTKASITSNAVDWNNGGWWVDLPNSGERVFVDMDLQLNTLAISTAIPNNNPCASGGSSWLYFLNAATGSKVSSASEAGNRFSPDTLIVGANFVKDATGNLRLITQDNKGKITTDNDMETPPPTSATAHRTSWRELVD
ncbi:MAG: pilus assembly protein [Aquabacterium sp.]